MSRRIRANHPIASSAYLFDCFVRLECFSRPAIRTVWTVETRVFPKVVIKTVLRGFPTFFARGLGLCCRFFRRHLAGEISTTRWLDHRWPYDRTRKTKNSKREQPTKHLVVNGTFPINPHLHAYLKKKKKTNGKHWYRESDRKLKFVQK